MTDDPRARGKPPEYVKVEKKKTNPLLWLVLATLALLVLLLLLSQCTRHHPKAVATAAPVAVAPTTEPYTSDLPTYLSGTDAAPRTFAFQQLHFDTNKADIRPEDQAEVDAAADALMSGASRIRIVGYADSTGASDENQKLGVARAEAVKAAMVTRGVNASRIETASGGDTNPIDTNATAGGRAENRRTELTILQR